MSSQTSLFLISFGAVLIMMSAMMPTPIYLILSGLVILLFGAYHLLKKKRG